MHRTAILERNLMLLHGIAEKLEESPDFSVAGAVQETEDFFDILGQSPVDLALIGIYKQNAINCVKVANRLKAEYPKIKTLVLIFDYEETESKVQKMLKLGATAAIEINQVPDMETLKARLAEVATAETKIGLIPPHLVIRNL